MNAYRIGLAGLFSAGLILSGCSSQQGDWQQAQQQNTVQAYQQYIQQYPQGDHVAAARQQIAHIQQQKEMQQARADWQRVQQANTPQAYQQFLQQHPDSQYAANAKQQIQQMQAAQDWMQVQQSNNPQALQVFIAQYPNSPQADQARQELARLQQAQQQKQQQMAAAKQAQQQQQQEQAQQPQGDYQVQLAAFSRQSRADKAQQLIQNQYQDLLGDVEVTVNEPGEGSSLYKLKTTAMSREKASSLCDSLRDKGQDCFVVRRSGSSTAAISK
ncbi:MAG TPA: SPOR domain-containing protein [Gammaproteobacteria bacterium]|nr:SPOR domain-containing protein [Gammaproteobacteria bacterium]